jgi:hypothetical protein
LAGFQKGAGNLLASGRQSVAHLHGTRRDDFSDDDPKPLQPFQMLKDEFAFNPQTQHQHAGARRLMQQQFQRPKPTRALKHRAEVKDLLGTKPCRFQPLKGLSPPFALFGQPQNRWTDAAVRLLRQLGGKFNQACLHQAF